MNQTEIIIQKIKESGLNNNQVEKAAGVQTGTLRRWLNEEPKSLGMLNKINKAIEILSNEVQRTAEIQENPAK